MAMAETLRKDHLSDGLQEGVVGKLLEADLLVAAEAFGASLDEKQKAFIDTATCSEKDVLQRVLKIADICGDELLAERAQQKIKFPGLKYDLSPATLSALDVYSERFYSFWEDGKLSYIRSEISDFPEWLHVAKERAEEILSAQDMENIIVICCARDRAQKVPLLCKLLNNMIETETIRLGFVYPARETAFKVLSDFFQRMKELLLIREQHDSSLHLGEHPEELIPYVWANIIKNLLSQNFCAALDNINALAYLHYVAQETESTTGTQAYSKLKKELLLFRKGTQRNWPNEIRKMFLDPTMLEALIRYRFTHGLIAMNTALAYRYAEKRDDGYLEPREEDAVVLNGLTLTEKGHLRSSGFRDDPTQEQFQRDVLYFKELKNVISHQSVDRFCSWHDELKTTRKELEEKLTSFATKMADVLEEKGKEIKSKEGLLEKIELNKKKAKKSIFKKLRSDGQADDQSETERLMAEIEKDKEDLKNLSDVLKMHEEMADYIRKTAGFFS
jgi:hypothetical protein